MRISGVVIDVLRERTSSWLGGDSAGNIFVTGAMGEERAVVSLHEGADDYIIKDRIARLPAAVARALDAANKKRQLHRF